MDTSLLAWQVLAVVLFMVSAVCIFLIVMGGPIIIRYLKYKIKKGKGGNWMLKFYDNGTADIDFTTPRGEVEFKNGEEVDNVLINKIYHYERKTGIPIHVVVQSQPASIKIDKEMNVNQMFPKTELSRLMNQMSLRQYNNGYLMGQNPAAGSSWKDNPILIVLIALCLLAAGVAAYFTLQNNEILTEVGTQAAQMAESANMVVGG